MTKIKQALKLRKQFKTTVRQILGTKLTNIINLSEKELEQLIADIESNPLFEKLKNEKLIKYARFPNTSFSLNFLELNESISAEKKPVDVESILETKQRTVDIIKKIGEQNFREYFIYAKDNLSNSEIAEKCGIPINEVKEIVDLVNEISIHSEFYNPSGFATAGQIRYNKIASVEKDSKNGFIINFNFLNLARGRYLIDYNKFENIKDRKLKTFIRNLELINTAKNVFYQILERIVSYQYEFLITGNLEKRKLLTQKMLAKEIGIDSSIVCRSIRGRSVDIPTGSEVPLKDFFCNSKNITKSFVKKIIEKEKSQLSDEKIKQILADDYKIVISRRSVAYYRKELGTVLN